jgi:hypothetical protein
MKRTVAKKKQSVPRPGRESKKTSVAEGLLVKRRGDTGESSGGGGGGSIGSNEEDVRRHAERKKLKEKKEKEETKHIVVPPLLGRDRLIELLGDDVYDELSGPDDERVSDMRIIAAWEREPLIPSSCDVLDGIDGKLTGQERREWQVFLRTHFSRLTLSQLHEFLKAHRGELHPKLGRSWSALMSDRIDQLRGFMVWLGETDEVARHLMLAQQPHPPIARTPPPTTRRPAADLPLQRYLTNSFGRVFVARAARDRIHTVGALRDTSTGTLSVILAESETPSATGATVDRDATVDGPRDRTLKVLCEMGIKLPRLYLLRYHAVYEWAIEQREARDTSVSLWTQWLWPGREVHLKLSASDGPSAWKTASTPTEFGSNMRFVRVRGTVLYHTPASPPRGKLALHPASSPPSCFAPPCSPSAVSNTSSSSASTSSTPRSEVPTCTVVLDPHQFSWLPDSVNSRRLDRAVTFALESPTNEATAVSSYMRQKIDGTEPVETFGSIVWSIPRDSPAYATYVLRLGQTPGRTPNERESGGGGGGGGFCIEPPAKMTAALAQSLSTRGLVVLVDRTARRGPSFRSSTVEGRVLRGGTFEDGSSFLQLWVDSHVVTLKSVGVRDRSHTCDSCRLGQLRGEHIEAFGTLAEFTVCYRVSLIGSLRTKIHRLQTQLSHLVGIPDLTKLVADMLL